MDLSLKDLSQHQPSGENRVKLLVIGSGPAGFSAALYAARAELDPVVLTGMEHGGQVALTYSVENYPGFPEGVGGIELVELFQKQAERFGAKVEFDTASEVDLSHRPFRVHTYNTEYMADALILANGASSKHLDVPGEVELTGRGVSYCATCDGWFFKDKDVVVVGGGDSALEESIFLTRYAKSVTIVHRRDELRAGAILRNRAMDNSKIKFVWNSVITEILGKEKVESVRLKDTLNGEVSEMPIDGVFIFIGHNPNNQLYQGQLDMDERGYVLTDMRMHTSVPGVFAAGELADPNFRQVITSAGMGAAAAMEATHFIGEHSGEYSSAEISAEVKP